MSYVNYHYNISRIGIPQYLGRLLPAPVSSISSNLPGYPSAGNSLAYLTPYDLSYNGETFRYIRVSDETIFGGDDYRLRHDYPKKNCWNRDKSLLKMSGSNGPVLEGIKRFRVISSFGTGIGEYWSKTDPNVLYGAYDNIFYKQTLDPVTKTKNTYTEPFTFSAYTEMNFQSDENNFDNNDQYCVLYGLKNGSTNVWGVVYDIQANSIIAQKEFVGVTKAEIDWMSVSPLGNYVCVAFFADGSGAAQGMKRYDIADWGNETHLIDYTEHGDFQLDTAGNEVFASFDYQSVPGYSFSMVRLADGVTTGLIPNAFNLKGGHASGQNYLQPGYIFVNPQGSLAEAQGGDAARVVLQIKLDNTETMIVWAPTFNNRDIGSDHFCGATPSPDGSMILINTNWEDTSPGGLQTLSVSSAHVLRKIN